MEISSVNSHKVLGGKSDSSSDYFQMVLRSGSRVSGNFTDGSTNLNSSSLQQSVKSQKHHQHSQQSPQHHHYHHHHHHHEQSQNFVIFNHQRTNHEEQQKYTIRQLDTGQSQHLLQSKVLGEEAVKKATSEKHQEYFSDYSSGVDDLDIDAEVKTDYTYAQSGSYKSRITPNRQCPSPNMSRSRLRRTSASYNSYHSSDESAEAEDEMFLRTKSHQSVSSSNSFHRTSTPALTSRGIEKNLYAFHKEFGEQISFLGDHTSQSILSQAMSSLFFFTSVISHTVYKFICTITSVDTFLLSRCCSSPSRKYGVLFLFLLLPLLWLLLSSDITKHIPSNYLSSLSTKSSYQALITEGIESPLNTLSATEAQKLYAQWQSELEKKIHEELERRWLEQTKLMENRWHEQVKQMENWQGVVSDRVKVLDIQTVKEEVIQLRSDLESQIRKEAAANSSTDEDLKNIHGRLIVLEEKQKVLEATLLEFEDCCKKQGLLPVGVSQAELAAQLSALAQEVRANLSQLVLLQSSAASHSSVDDIHFTHKINSSYVVPTLGEIQEIIKTAINRYDADKTGLVDYALESAGGSVISTRCTESYPQGTAQFSLFGVPFWYSANTPRTVIQPQVHPGECWAMRGTQGYLVIQLSASIRPTAFSLEHIPRELSPTGKIDSAPKEFSVIGLLSEKDTEGTLLGKYTYEDNGESLQKFSVQSAEGGIFSIVELRVHSNHGNPEYTCLYRFRVHGVRQ